MSTARWVTDVLTWILMFHYDHAADPELQGRIDALEGRLRTIGLYVDETRVISDGDRQAVVVDCFIGDVAYSARIQDPEQAEMDTTFRRIVAADQAHGVEQVRDDLLRRLGKGDAQ